jgi:septal ring factor EnvC (AmiA/AmiB activator)
VALDMNVIAGGLVSACLLAAAAWQRYQTMRVSKADTDQKVEIAKSGERVYEQLNERLAAQEAQVKRLTTQVDALQERVRVRDARIHTLELHIKDLEHFIRAQNLEPPVMPK